MHDDPGGAEKYRVPSAGVDEAGGAGRGLVEELRGLIRSLEQVPVSFGHPPAPGADLGPAACFSPASSGAPPEDAPPLHHLSAPGLHELKPHAHADAPAAVSFALGLLRLKAQLAAPGTATFLWCLTDSQLAEWGAPYGPGLLQFGLDPARLLIVRVRNAGDAAWALEEGLKSGALSGLLGQADIRKPLMARRLGLAAKAGGIPCLLLPGRTETGGLPGSLSRWRIRAERSPPARFDGRAPGLFTFSLTLERAPGSPPQRSWRLQWNELSHATYGFRLAPPLADRAADAAAGQTSRSTG